MLSRKLFTKNRIVIIAVTAIIVVATILAFSTLRIQAANSIQDLKPIQTSTLNGVTVSLDQVDFTSANPAATVCINLPTNKDWLPSAHIETATGSISLEGIALLDAKNPATYAGTFRCYSLTFLQIPNLAGTQVKIVLDKIHTTVPELISADLCNNARIKAQAAQPGLDFSCVTASNDGGFTINKKPNGLSDQQAMDLIISSLTKTVNGPWLFSVTP